MAVLNNAIRTAINNPPFPLIPAKIRFFLSVIQVCPSIRDPKRSVTSMKTETKSALRNPNVTGGMSSRTRTSPQKLVPKRSIERRARRVIAAMLVDFRPDPSDSIPMWTEPLPG